jgi:hypothetical protein
MLSSNSCNTDSKINGNSENILQNEIISVVPGYSTIVQADFTVKFNPELGFERINLHVGRDYRRPN